MFNFLKKLLSNPRKNLTPASVSLKHEERKEIYKKNDDILDGERFVATLYVKTPLKYLEMHGTVVEVGKSIEPEDMAYGIWVPEVRDDLKIPGFEGELASPVGPIPTDGGMLLPLLKEVRKIVEKPVEPSRELIAAQERVKPIMNIVTKSDYPTIFDSEDDCFGFLIKEYVGSIKYLTVNHYRELIDKGCSSIEDISSLTDDQLLALKGIGPTKLKSIRHSLI